MAFLFRKKKVDGELKRDRIEVRASSKRFAKSHAKRKLKQKVRNARHIKVINVYDIGDGVRGKAGFNRYGVHLSYVIPSKDAKKQIERISGRRVVREKKDEGVEVVSW